MVDSGLQTVNSISDVDLLPCPSKRPIYKLYTLSQVPDRNDSSVWRLPNPGVWLLCLLSTLRRHRVHPRSVCVSVCTGSSWSYDPGPPSPNKRLGQGIRVEERVKVLNTKEWTLIEKREDIPNTRPLLCPEGRLSPLLRTLDFSDQVPVCTVGIYDTRPHM